MDQPARSPLHLNVDRACQSACQFSHACCLNWQGAEGSNQVPRCVMVDRFLKADPHASIRSACIVSVISQISHFVLFLSTVISATWAPSTRPKAVFLHCSFPSSQNVHLPCFLQIPGEHLIGRLISPILDNICDFKFLIHTASWVPSPSFHESGHRSFIRSSSLRGTFVSGDIY